MRTSTDLQESLGVVSKEERDGVENELVLARY